MFNGQDTEGNELNLDVIPEAESDENTQDSGNTEGEFTEETLQLETEVEKVDKLSPQEANAKAQEEAWLTKVTSGKADVEDAPTWLQKRLNARLKATNNVPETEEVVKKVLAQEREAQEFKDLQKQIPRLTADQAKQLNDKFAEYKPLGNVKALATALEILGLSSKMKEAEARGIAKGRVSFPASGQSSVRKSSQSVGGVPLDTIHSDKAWNEMIRRGSQN